MQIALEWPTKYTDRFYLFLTKNIFLRENSEFSAIVNFFCQITKQISVCFFLVATQKKIRGLTAKYANLSAFFQPPQTSPVDWFCVWKFYEK